MNDMNDSTINEILRKYAEEKREKEHNPSKSDTQRIKQKDSNQKNLEITFL